MQISYDDDLKCVVQANMRNKSYAVEGAKTRTTPNIKQQDTTPDLTWTDSRTARKTEWKVFEDTWGSDHHPIKSSILGKAKRRKKKRTVKTTVWDDFLAALEESTGTTFDDLTKLMREAAKTATVETLVEIGAPIPDTRLLSLWRKRSNYLRRYRRTRKKRDIRKANRYAKEAQRHANNLCRDDWTRLCEGFNERTSLRRMWAVCNTMLGKSKGGNTAPNLALAENKEVKQILDEIGDVFFPQPATSPNPGHSRTHALMELSVCNDNSTTDTGSHPTVAEDNGHPSLADPEKDELGDKHRQKAQDLLDGTSRRTEVTTNFMRTLTQHSKTEWRPRRRGIMRRQRKARSCSDVDLRRKRKSEPYLKPSKTRPRHRADKFRTLARLHGLPGHRERRSGRKSWHTEQFGEIFRLAQNLERRDLNPLTIRVEWIPGHAGIAGNERAHRAAIEELNRIDLRRQVPGPAPSVEPPPAHLQLPPEASIPSGTFRRHETVTLRRLRAQAGITPARTQRWERAARERKSKLANASTAVDHDYSLLSKKQRKEEEACTEGCIYCRNRDVKCDECHLIWHCPIFNEERTKALNTLEQQHRPTCFEAWCKPVGDKDMRVAVLSGLLRFLSETGLDIHI
ncbi:hypothetical protein HPB47_011058 [Ixodes persulcatus]|uniref:Uncharacterized protein n=1 Tax=Ixodes persulcatus TaxID=34615 RepID=A0AC60NXC4_IXOPE|nr:hypothetical protein HPB47_011058 [Ixodes persulcatus]